MRKLIFLICILHTMIYAQNTMSKKSYERLMKVEKHIELGQIKQAKKFLDEMIKGKNKYSSSYAYKYLASLALQKNNYKAAKEYYKKIVKFNSLDKEQIDRIKFSLSKIYLFLEEFNKSILISNDLLKTSSLKKTDIYETLIYSYYYTQKFHKSILYSEKYIKLSPEKKENIYQVLYSSYIELKEYHKAIQILTIMVKKWTDKSAYWLQLTSLYHETQQYNKALSTIELAYKKGILDPKKNINFFVNLLIQNELYNKASIVLEDAIQKGDIKEDEKIFKLLISTYLNAHESNKAIKKLKNSKFAQNVKYIKILANLYYKQNNYKAVVNLLSSKEKKIKFDGDLQILLALSYYELDNKDKTSFYLKKALHSKKKKQALQIAKTLRMNIKNF